MVVHFNYTLKILCAALKRQRNGQMKRASLMTSNKKCASINFTFSNLTLIVLQIFLSTHGIFFQR
jgi:hypothetical protein